MENFIYWSFCSFVGTWGSEISVKFSTLTREQLSLYRQKNNS